MSFPLDKYALPGVVTMAGLYQMGHIARMVGKARGKYKVSPPETAGPPEFERIFRAQQNTLEFAPLSLGGLWVGSIFFHPVPASVLYGGYLIGRARYAHGYAESADKRLPGFKMSNLFLRLLIYLATLGVAHKALRHFTDIDLLVQLQERIPALKFE